ncbi:hypothetical protein [Methanosarcina horonobensis]|uniref:hypothetical protein n=1 Tax=Methanosarcina horonobensis TaxID=418008 RepID=UPI000A7B8E22|nr:hypothetical protein [Methanosarcina horonobensis]
MTERKIEGEGGEEEIPFVPAEPDPFWERNAEKLVGESISAVKDTAKQFVVATGLLQEIYFHSIAFSEIRRAEGYSVFIFFLLSPVTRLSA